MRIQFVSRATMIAVLSAVVSLLSRTALAQSGANSDLLRVTVSTTGATGSDILPPLEIPVPEGTPEGTVTAPILPGANILYTELGPSGPPSDFLHINQYQVVIQSDLEGGLQRRTSVPAVAIPASANEVFLPVSIFAGSDGNQGTTTTESDHVTIYTGFFGQPNPVPVFQRTITELPDSPTAPAEIIEFATGPLFFDLLQPDGTGLVSDYVDLPNGITGYFLSSDNPSDFASQPPATAIVFEDPLNGVEVHYSVGFASDTEVPEPASCVLLSLGTLALAASGWRRRRME